MLNYNHLYYFHVAASEGSVAAAAEKLGVTQPTVSEQVRSLERALHARLFERIPSGLRLTDAGRLAFEHTSVMFRASERLVASFHRGMLDLPHTLTVGLSAAVARATSSDFLFPLLALPDCVPIIHTGDSVDLLRGLREADLDLVLSENEPPGAARHGLEIVAVANTTLVAVAQPDLALDEDWRNVGFIHYRPSSSYRWEIEAYLSANGLNPRMAGEADDAIFMAEAAARGGYVAIVPRAIARERIADGQLAVLAEFEPAQSGVFALFETGAHSELARRATEVLVAAMHAQRA